MQVSGGVIALQSSLSVLTRRRWTAFAADLINGVCLVQLSFKARLSVLYEAEPA